LYFVPFVVTTLHEESCLFCYFPLNYHYRKIIVMPLLSLLRMLQENINIHLTLIPEDAAWVLRSLDGG
jgi:hypothetical protein